MPYIHFVEIWTPLKMVGVRFYRDDEGDKWVKLWGLKRRKL